MKKEILADCCLSLVILLFSYTALSKLLDLEKFVFQMRLAPFPLMYPMAPVLGWLVPAVELMIVTGLLVKRFRIRALYAAVLLLLLFEVYIMTMLASGLHLPCTCGGIISKMSWKQHLAFNALFMLTGITGIYQLKKQPVSRSGIIEREDSKDLSRA